MINKLSEEEKKRVKEFSNKSSGMGRFLLVFLFRLLLLVVGGGFAALLGVALAIVAPATAPEKPLAIEGLELIPGFPKSPESNNRTSTSSSTSQTVQTSESASPPSTLTKAERRKLEAELKQLQRQLKKDNNSNEALEARVQAIEQQLNGTTQPALPQTNSSPLISPDTLIATLPADNLFEDSQAFLRQRARPILNKLIGELQNYPGATVCIRIHTDGVGEADNNRMLSFRQAQEIEQYLSKTLGDKYHWVAVGYGESSPLFPNDSTLNRQQNRRVEIKILPK